jgi:hypothetical protein
LLSNSNLGRRSARTAILAGASALSLVGGPAFAAPGVDPATVNQSANPGTSFTVNKVVHTPAIPPKPDIVFTVDTTGSMGGAIDNVKANLHTIVTDVRGSQPDADFAVVSYKDQSDGAGIYQVVTPLTAIEADVQTGVDALSAGGGGDTPEAFINALYQDSTGSISYRADSSRIVVLIGDSSSHDPSNGHTLTDAIAALQAANIKVVAVAVKGGGDGLDAATQASQVVTATGGQLVPASSPSDVTNAILSGLHNLDVTVTPDVVSCDGGLSASLNKGAVTVTSGDDVAYVETVTVAGDATQGATLHCTVRFLLNGTDAGDAFVEHITVHVNDVTPPVVTVDDQTVEATSPAGAVINYPATAVDNVDGPLTPTCVPPPGSTFPLGDTGVTCTATDAAGNTGTDTATMHVVDTTPPTVGCVLGPNPDGTIVPAPEAGFRTLRASDIVDTAVDIFVTDNASTAKFGPYPSGTNIKLIQAPGATPAAKPGQGAVNWIINLKGDAVLLAVDNFGNTATVTCLVPPPPK